ncbi:TRAP transporter small permease subunit [Sulfitobacter sp. MF3-043]|uniref:TRAP transporter small permease subunit n=1 Tax=Sulfitobacter sediminivivens TaxID=3252902 RepID=UPI0036DED2AF
MASDDIRLSFTVYSVVMRSVFKDPPIWGDLLTVLSNIWLVFFCAGLDGAGQGPHRTRHDLQLVAPKAAFLVQQFWTAVIFCLGIVMIVWGIEAVATMGGKYWEMWYFAW